MMQELSGDDTNGESTFEFVERRLEDLHLENPSVTGVAGPSSLPVRLSTPIATAESDATAASFIGTAIAGPAPLPPLFSQQIAPVPTYSVPNLPPQPLIQPPFVTPVTQPIVTALSKPEPVVSPFISSAPIGNVADSVQLSQPIAASTALDFSYPVYESAGGSGGTVSGIYPSSYDSENIEKAEKSGVWGWIKGTVTGNEFLSKVAEKAKNSVDSVITTLDPQMTDYIYSGGDIHVTVASDKEVKVQPIREAFQTVLGRATFVQGLAVQASIAAQPVGFSAGLKGAEDRIMALRQSGVVPERQPIVAIENTLVEATPERWFDVGCLVLDDPSIGQAIHSYTQLVPVPLEYVTRLQNDTPADYPLRWSGYSMTVGQVYELVAQVSRYEWQQFAGSVTRRDMIFMAAKVLATEYKRRREASNFHQPAWSMG
ncbi:hypothetical protein CHUAL_004393 [Chamberlinius hualienensis]